MATKLMKVDAELTRLRIEELERQLAAEHEVLDNAKPSEPSGENRVIRFAKYGNTYCFAAIKITQTAVVGDTTAGRVVTTARWYITQDGSRTSRQGHAPKSWDALLQWIGERNWTQIEVLS